ncbi:MAG: apolipoprotein N-acyltransferase [Fimbriimonadaceae bacterium]
MRLLRRLDARWGLTKAWPIAASALMYALAFAPSNFVLLVFVALTPWWVSLAKAPNGRAAWRSGYFFGMLFWGFQLFWLVPFISNWTGSIVSGLIPWILCMFLGANYFGLTAVLIRFCWVRKQAWLIPLVWVGIEVIRSYFPVLAFPWGLLATPLAHLPYLIQLAHYGTIYLVGLWVGLFNLLCAWFLVGERPQTLFRAAMIFMVGTMASIALFARPIEGIRTKFTVGQLGTDLAFGDPATEPDRVRVAADAIIGRAKTQGAEFVILSEGIAEGGATLPPATPFLPPTPPPAILFGGKRGDGKVFQSAFGFDGEWSYADKTRLVIFGEYVPLRGVLPFLDRFNLPSGDLVPGERTTPIDLNGVRFGPILCFEALFWDVAFKQQMQGSQVLAVLSLDDWYLGTQAPAQLNAGSVWRAVETGLPVVRAAALGTTLAVDQRGRVVTQAKLGELTALYVELEVERNPERQPWKAWLVAGFALFVPAFWIWSIVRGRREPQ